MGPAARKRPDYGIDAPLVIAVLLLVSTTGFAVAAVVYALGVRHPLGIPLFEIGLVIGANFLLNVGLMLWYSKVGKLRGRERLLDLVPWRGDEAVLDVGCGRGLLLAGAARRLSTGRAVGIDIWQQKDLAGNRPEAALENARLEGVGERAEVLSADARCLPFADDSFDVIVSGLVLHNIPARAERERAVREMARVLRPGGHLALVDIQYTRDYVRTLEACGLGDLKRSPAGRFFWLLNMILTWGGVRFYRVTARKRAVTPSG